MEPTLSIGDVLVTRSVDDATSLRVGDIVTIEDADGLYTHRVVELGPETVRTQGDANETPDAEAVPRDAVVAHTVGHLASPWSTVVTSTRPLAAGSCWRDCSSRWSRRRGVEFRDEGRPSIGKVPGMPSTVRWPDSASGGTSATLPGPDSVDEVPRPGKG